MSERIKIRQMLVDPSKYSIKCPNKVNLTRIVVHNTANDASANNEVKYMITNNNEVSFHIAVDDVEAVQGIPFDRNTWNAGDGKGKGNMEGLSIEICYSKSGGERFIKAEQNAAKLIAQLLKERGWGIDRVTKHQDYNGKYCPHRTLDMGWSRFLNMIKAEMGIESDTSNSTNSSVSTSNADVNIYYRVKTQKHGWLPEVRNLEDYAGWEGSPITGVAMKVDKGSIKYRVHIKGQGWLPYVTGYNTGDYNNGYAGNGGVVDAVEAYYYTPSDIRPFKRVKYSVNAYPWQYDNEKSNGQDGYAGVFGVTATKLRMEIV